MKKKVTEPTRMSYQTYLHLKHLIDQDVDKLESDYRTACRFIPSERYDPKKPSGLDKAHKIFSEGWWLRNKMLEELHAAAQATYKDHPDIEIKKFWCVE